MPSSGWGQEPWRAWPAQTRWAGGMRTGARTRQPTESSGGVGCTPSVLLSFKVLLCVYHDVACEASCVLTACRDVSPACCGSLWRVSQVERCWRLAAQLLGWLQRLPPGPYLLRLDLAAQRLELCGVGGEAAGA